VTAYVEINSGGGVDGVVILCRTGCISSGYHGAAFVYTRFFYVTRDILSSRLALLSQHLLSTVLILKTNNDIEIIII
jgi:hypothetical protein